MQQIMRLTSVINLGEVLASLLHYQHDILIESSENDCYLSTFASKELQTVLC